MMWVRGFAADYDEWGALAGDDWDFAHTAKYFERIERGPLVLHPSAACVTFRDETFVKQCYRWPRLLGADSYEGIPRRKLSDQA